ncbi:MAG TPA: DUF72 domain-containing protein [Dehalococcoidia bacterium]|nr:DUF72 domain-containing protein [Dehalococcoidia bacterium]
MKSRTDGLGRDGGPGDIVVGCCGFPVGRRRYYAEFPAVEVQQTFYQLPRVETARKWRAEAPPGFAFAMKAWQLVTHAPSSPTYRRLREPLTAPPDAYGWFRPTDEVREAWRRTFEVARALDSPAIVFQCPASFAPTETSVANLRAFFRAAERDGRTFVWEPRGEWPPELVADVCRELRLVHGVDPFAGPTLGGDVAYFRLHGRGGHRYRYTDEDLRELLGRCQRELAAGRRPVYVMFNNVSMLDDARRFRALVERDGRD